MVASSRSTVPAGTSGNGAAVAEFALMGAELYESTQTCGAVSHGGAAGGGSEGGAAAPSLQPSAQLVPQFGLLLQLGLIAAQLLSKLQLPQSPSSSP